MTSIFTIERRKDFPAAFAKFFEDLQTEVTTSSGNKYKMFLFLDRCIIQNHRLVYEVNAGSRYAISSF